jgi:hypothetical protein
MQKREYSIFDVSDEGEISCESPQDNHHESDSESVKDDDELSVTLGGSHFFETYEKLDDATKLKKDFMYVMRSIDGKSFSDPKNEEQTLQCLFERFDEIFQLSDEEIFDATRNHRHGKKKSESDIIRNLLKGQEIFPDTPILTIATIRRHFLYLKKKENPNKFYCVLNSRLSPFGFPLYSELEPKTSYILIYPASDILSGIVRSNRVDKFYLLYDALQFNQVNYINFLEFFRTLFMFND